MNIFPSKEHFIRTAEGGRIYPVSTELPFIPPQRVYERLGSPFSFLLESIKGPERIARYSFVGADPFMIFRIKDGQAEIYCRERTARSGGEKTGDVIRSSGYRPCDSVTTRAPLRKLKELLRQFRVAPAEHLPPFTGGAVGLIGYDFVHYLENIPRNASDDLALPDAHFLVVDTVVAVDHKLQKTFIITCPVTDEQADRPGGNEEENWESRYDRACEKIGKLSEKLIPSAITAEVPQSTFQKRSGSGSEHRGALHSVDRTGSGTGSIPIRHEMGKAAYMDIVRRTKEYIRAGDIFQANLSQRVSADIGDIAPWRIYRILSSINPSPFAAYLDMGEYHIVSSSPERLVRVNGNNVETRPIAGTRPRGRDAEGDRRMRTELLLNEKERAEHIMLIDLERNDLGKVSDYTTVRVDEFMITEEYSHVIHIVSNVVGTLAEGKDCFDVIRATFPGGTITGVPKVRCMEIIDELEPVTRGPYTGSVGYIGFNGNMDLNIIIRTFVIKDRTAYVQAGAGIVADSDPEREYYETLKKAEALIRTLGKL